MKDMMLAMILAGGQGSRLGPLTRNLAKPAVPFGGKYRIIDFVLSNCANSKIRKAAVLTQYQPLILNEHIGNGSPWDLNGRDGGVSILQPFASATEEKWFKGTAHAIYQNLPYIEAVDAEYVLILSGDHVYKMNYEKMLNFHKEKKAALTIAVIEVPWDEASRFGIMATDENMFITEFAEKPKEPKSNLASMGIYIFSFDALKKYLTIKDENGDGMIDFGHDVIPRMIKDQEAVVAYPFKGYWKDVGTIESLWEANMDLIDPDSELKIQDQSWRIYSVNHTMPPQYITSDAKVRESLIVEGCIVHGEVCHSVLSMGVRIGKGSLVKDSIIMSNTVIGDNCVINKAMIGENCRIADGQTIGDGQTIQVVAESSVVGGAE
ncbi:glucose-1-phosphate adenylyltransferase [Proteiniclasticum sp. QWL-01]|jgi:glucose-1-phosphate adenylyltransferase|uniref:glucose-1-phosphate adenylyltransferase n=1 Tax=Proteiniclasticum sp. QWL-01 TaxID=3036945 RepID=UPI00241026B3|nr:glucose-1-phosphate adenylyltransferase [Proteiniclasticum sp. QWL-01]WFF71590.1 glucose-1-phosphate adenylyltransferase [Proteiniclasticum sp. QWL-01]